MYKRNGALLTGTFWQYLGPSLLSTTSILLGSIVDGIIVGNLIGPDAMSAVNLTQPVVLVVQALFFLFGMGAATAISIARGRREEAQANALFTMGSLCLLAVSIAVAALGTVGIDGVVAVLCSNEALSGLVRSYASTIIVGAPFMLVVPGLVYVIRVDGMPRMSAAVLVVANVVNLVLDLVFIAVFGMGIAGAALATVVGYAAGGCIVLGYFVSKRRTLRFASLGEPRKLLAPIIDGGVAPALNTCLLFAKILLLNRIVLAVAGQGGHGDFRGMQLRDQLRFDLRLGRRRGHGALAGHAVRREGCERNAHRLSPRPAVRAHRLRRFHRGDGAGARADSRGVQHNR